MTQASEKKMKSEVIVTAKCVGCGKTREIRAGEIPDDEQPMCDICYMPMIAEKAERKL